MTIFKEKIFKKIQALNLIIRNRLSKSLSGEEVLSNDDYIELARLKSILSNYISETLRSMSSWSSEILKYDLRAPDDMHVDLKKDMELCNMVWQKHFSHLNIDDIIKKEFGGK